MQSYSAGYRQTKIAMFCLAILAGLLTGCSRDPLAQARAQKHATADHWQLFDDEQVPDRKPGGPKLGLFIIKAKNQFETPNGPAGTTLWFWCEQKKTSAWIRSDKAIDSGDVTVSFDGAEPADQKWDHKLRNENLLNVPGDLTNDFALNLGQSKTFDIEFTPKGG